MDLAWDGRKVFGLEHLDYAKIQHIRRVYNQMMKRRKVKW